jgi:hypothetical protein
VKPNALHRRLARIAAKAGGLGRVGEDVLARAFSEALGPSWKFWCWRSSSDAAGRKENTDPTGAAIYWNKAAGGEGRKVAFVCFKQPN